VFAPLLSSQSYVPLDEEHLSTIHCPKAYYRMTGRRASSPGSSLVAKRRSFKWAECTAGKNTVKVTTNMILCKLRTCQRNSRHTFGSESSSYSRSRFQSAASIETPASGISLRLRLYASLTSYRNSSFTSRLKPAVHQTQTQISNDSECKFINETWNKDTLFRPRSIIVR